MARSGKVRGVGPWARVAEKVGQRRVDLRISQERAAALAGTSRETWGKLESGRQHGYRPDTLIGVCRVLRWAPESISLILDGREPIELPEDKDAIDARLTALEM
jgi:transcriptional regulator with XRE-family HTH domain